MLHGVTREGISVLFKQGSVEGIRATTAGIRYIGIAHAVRDTSGIRHAIG